MEEEIENEIIVIKSMYNELEGLFTREQFI